MQRAAAAPQKAVPRGRLRLSAPYTCPLPLQARHWIANQLHFPDESTVQVGGGSCMRQTAGCMQNTVPCTQQTVCRMQQSAGCMQQAGNGSRNRAFAAAGCRRPRPRHKQHAQNTHNTHTTRSFSRSTSALLAACCRRITSQAAMRCFCTRRSSSVTGSCRRSTRRPAYPSPKCRWGAAMRAASFSIPGSAVYAVAQPGSRVAVYIIARRFTAARLLGLAPCPAAHATCSCLPTSPLHCTLFTTLRSSRRLAFASLSHHCIAACTPPRSSRRPLRRAATWGGRTGKQTWQRRPRFQWNSLPWAG